MKRTINIKNLRNVKSLTFDLPSPGVHLLTGTNGAGKTSLLACLRRIGESHAFAHHFGSSQNLSLDNFNDAEIKYTINNQAVTYIYGGQRWVPRPRKYKDLLNSFGYSSVLYIGATADRITPSGEELKLKKQRPAKQEVRDAINEIFDTQKYDNLKTINLSRGGGRNAFLLQIPSEGKSRNKYYSERHFSLGELSILKLVVALLDADVNSLVLIDELEIALHPKVQIQLLQYLKRIAHEKALTVIFSTHSVSLLKGVERENIIFLDKLDGDVVAHKGCFPTYALGHIAYGQEFSPDLAVCVEDDAARSIVIPLIKRACIEKYGNDSAYYPAFEVIPIGGYDNVVSFLTRSEGLVGNSTKICALLDGDVQDTIATWRANNNHVALANFQRHESKIFFLPWAPEVRIVDWLQADPAEAQRKLRAFFDNNRITVRGTDYNAVVAKSGADRRRASKVALREFVNKINSVSAETSFNETEKAIYKVFSNDVFSLERGLMMQLFSPILQMR